MKIVFMGTDDFAVPTLEKLVNKTQNSDHQIVAVYTRPPVIANRGNKISLSNVHQYAISQNLPIFTPHNFNHQDEIDNFVNLGADIVIVVSYGVILPQKILDVPKFGCLNIHPSLLPRWRGASPIQHSIMANDIQTAVMVIKMTAKLDAGAIVDGYHYPMQGNENYRDLSIKFASIGANLISAIIDNIASNPNCNLLHIAIEQNTNFISYAHKITGKNAIINFNNNAKDIEAMIRGLNGYEEAYFNYQNDKIKIFAAEIIGNSEILKIIEDSKISQQKLETGTIIDKNLTILCKDGAIRPLILQKSGKKILSIKEFLLGFRLVIGSNVNSQ
jgi:methionyl-tRNA formyltransferase